MPNYIYQCMNEECEEVVEIFCPVSKRKKRVRCPECEEWCEQIVCKPGEEPPGLIFKGHGWYTNKSRDRKYAEKGMDKQTADRWLNDEIKNSQERLNSGNQHYKRYTPDYESLHKAGMVKRVSDKRAIEKKEMSKKLTEEAYKKAGLDPTKPATPQPI